MTQHDYKAALDALEMLLEVGSQKEEIAAIKTIRAAIKAMRDERDELLKALKEALPLLRLLTVKQVIEGGHELIIAAGLNEWCINEGLADGNESLDLWKFQSAIKRAEGKNDDLL